MDLTTQYLGLELAHPIVPGAGPLADDLDTVRKLEDAGAPMITLRSLFEEQIVGEQMAHYRFIEASAESYAEATSYMPKPKAFAFGPTEYLEHLAKVKRAVRVPVVASLNGTTAGGWLEYAQLMEQAGADALELNVYAISTDANVTGRYIEDETVQMVRQVKERVTLPVAVKLSPFYTSLPEFLQRLDTARVDAMVLFNRFYQPDIDVEELDVVPTLHLSDSRELLVRLRWTAILYGQVRAPLAVTGGIHTHTDAVKALMCGASVVQVVSALLQRGPGYLQTLRQDLERWIEEHGYESLRYMRGNMSLRNCPNRQAFERANYMQVLQSWHAQ